MYNKVNGQGIPCGRNSSYSFYHFFKTLLVFWSWSADIHVVWIKFADSIFLLFFCKLNLAIFSGIIFNKVNGQGIPCGRNSSYSFIPILLKLRWRFGHGLKKYSCGLDIILIFFFVTFCKLNLAIFRHYL